MRIQHNVMAMNAYRNYSNNTSALSKNLERLSSGYKINRAGDDAAGLAISEKMRAQISGLEAAQKNVKDGTSLVNTAEGAMQEIQDMLNRMVSLATQSANGTYDNEVDRKNLQAEVDQLKEEINRIADSSNFNGIKLLDGSLDTGTNTVELNGATNQTVTVVADGQLAAGKPTAGKYTVDFSQAQVTNNTATEQTLTFTLNGDYDISLKVAANTTLSGQDLANEIAKAIKGTTGTTDGTYDADKGFRLDYNGGDSTMYFDVGVEGNKLVFQMKEPPVSNFDTQMQFQFDLTSFDGDTGPFTITGEQFQVTPEVEAVPSSGRAYGQATFTLAAANIKDGSAVKIGDTIYTFAVGKNSKFKDVENVIDLTEYETLKATDSGIVAQRLAAAAQNNKNFFVGCDITTGKISLTEKEGGVDYSVNNLAGTDNKAGLNGSGGATNATSTNWKGLVQLGTASIKNDATGTALVLQIGDTSDSYNQLAVSIKDMHTTSLGIDDINIGTPEGAQSAIDTIKAAINTVSAVRGNLGAISNRLDHTANNLSVMTENITDAESTIRDTDIAEEMMSYTKNNILVQSAQAMLAQANQVPQGVLQLLQ